ncbi:MAG: hypothetical protein RMK43_12890, partial [Cyclobacteriaceae bacterium]|nr:hypothetical protein [Cyclobacteriaceae bacterium]
MKTGVLLGKLKRLDVVQQENEKPRFLYPKNRWLAWDPKSKNLLIVKYKKRVHKHLPKQIQHLHKKFH